MRKQYSERSIYDSYLKELEKDIFRNKERKSQVRSKILLSINKLEQKTKMQIGFKYVSSIGVFIVFLFFGYQSLSSNITYNNGEVSTEPNSNQTDNFFVTDDSDDKEIRNDSGKNNTEIPNMDLRLPKYIPSQVNSEPQHVKGEHSDRTGLAEVRYMDSESYFFDFAQSKLDVSKEDAIQQVKNEMYKNEVLEEIEIAGHPSFIRLEGDTSYYSSLHIITDKYFITLTTHGIEKEEILKIANSIDLVGL